MLRKYQETLVPPTQLSLAAAINQSNATVTRVLVYDIQASREFADACELYTQGFACVEMFGYMATAEQLRAREQLHVQTLVELKSNARLK